MLFVSFTFKFHLHSVSGRIWLLGGFVDLCERLVSRLGILLHFQCDA